MGSPERFEVAVLGGGAAGIAAAIAAARGGKSVVICEHMPRLGKKILASGNGRCNLLNENLSEKFYNTTAQPLVKNVFAKFGRRDILDFFEHLGLKTYSDSGRIFPATNQSSSVLKVLEMELSRLAVSVELNFKVTDITSGKDGFLLSSGAGRRIASSSLVIAAGGRSYPALGSDGASYKFAEQFGHKVIAPVPAAVALMTKDRICHLLQGQKISAGAKAIIGGKISAEAAGEVLFTKYGLSGTAILDISRDISVAINRFGDKGAKVAIDMVPFIKENDLASELKARMEKKYLPEEMIAGILPNKFGGAFADALKLRNASAIAKIFKSKEFLITGTRGWNEADFTAGGIATGEVDAATLESKFKKGLYFAGEILDVDGCRGGYNLAWAWASGHLAGASA